MYNQSQSERISTSTFKSKIYIFNIKLIWFYLLGICALFSCKKEIKTFSPKDFDKKEKTTSKSLDLITKIPDGISIPDGMQWIPGGEFYQGAVDHDTIAMNHEKPRHKVAIKGFFMDTVEVTNAQFKKFVEATGYITLAERPVNWEELKLQLPPNTPRPHDSILQPGSLVFHKTKSSVTNFRNYAQWWNWTIGANWKHPSGPKSSIEGKDNQPVVHIAFEDALAYCKWAKKRLPTEAEWEYAARGGIENDIFFWGNDHTTLTENANTWTGEFPVYNDQKDGTEYLADVGSYPSNSYGLYDMAGNVWEWTTDWYNVDYYKEISQQDVTVNPKGASKPLNPSNPYATEKIIKGGSFLCSDTYCASYRSSARMNASPDSSTDHIGFRTVVSIDQLLSKTSN
ncbi:formylglycine-generating enzyme family protein [Aquimarina spongiae]|uniref:Formylglycine-generating enzyme, required for sulfatase activity, contains SUMF1/FGE domain n=1 Tax=Aquimarina spongiae TaxID=570521 RepID=A0A1M6A1P2_9FLAO|nr:formylglycine-generating enzyme family protein [Aquimarina spongiae]SHI30376.1 Formylglycine-generating enzyme, required for sulfatase activity, contains SUMF1/FGE domain [Aquimarina spongiae]